MEKQVRIVAFGCIALGALLVLVAGYRGAAVATWLILAALASLAALRRKRGAQPTSLQ